MASVEGLNRLLKNFNQVNFRIPNIESRFLDVIGEESLEMLRANTPVDTGNLRDSWQLQKSAHEIVVANDQQDLLSLHLFGSIHHPMPRNFVQQVNDVVEREVLNTLEKALAENHRWFSKLPGGKGRKFQQVGRTSAGFKGGVTFAGRATLIRAGTGRRQLKRRLSLRRRRGGSINPARKDVKLG
jgi:hypothetical protein